MEAWKFNQILSNSKNKLTHKQCKFELEKVVFDIPIQVFNHPLKSLAQGPLKFNYINKNTTTIDTTSIIALQLHFDL